MNNQSNLYDIGVIGLGVMGKNLALNIADNQYRVAAFDLDELKVQDTVLQEELERKRYLKKITEPRIEGCNNFSEMLSKLEKPRVLLLSVPAGAPVDGVCQSLIEAGIDSDDIVIDTGNSLWTDTVEREQRYANDFLFFSCAVSGGEVGARFGPSLMPSGSLKAWNRIEPIWQAIAAKVDAKTGLPIERFEPGNPVKEGEPCTTYIGPAGSGHYVKMVHNGIEYADMQLICEAYQLLTQGLGLTASEVGEVFERWNKGSLNSYLMEISADILKQADPLTGAPLVEMILDKAGQKGTGLWTAVSSLQIGCPAPTIAEAVYARALSTQKTQRQQLSQRLLGPTKNLVSIDKQAFIEQLESALYCAKVSCYAQGFQLMTMQAKEQGWQLDFAEIAKIWRAGCIIRAKFLQSITQAYQQDGELENLLMADTFAKALSEKQQDWRVAVSQAVLSGIPAPCISSALAYYDSYRCKTLPASLLQGQRDYFGAHTFERIDKPVGEKYHLNWSGDRSLNKV
ncbi:NADP-dependent phosphogluconate dehydrogenase [Shewanella schlegeliana]|uniref:6-phosphogluconate dehydrogenase, decarboxylating n=1 Tax=Shewanella schlegeliana TaxID=190308 RepID=A0ABS1SXS1_9GAMM|nr:NADP-dependent phosphogluconate dehydrogenase [Shewanella schlegeliana]MBL4913350.1 NADP-dependent phosphogluconate dehydrogenase [Shewanella schlegeliana]MCL1109305.1 NADP-dependent phosphogluconate dehydrogenase [Shewanella schlegeliana]GIU24822.1 6-phosphogluconate dehydrogenase, decarboxylating [Shewanella schlegeliana]